MTDSSDAHRSSLETLLERWSLGEKGAYDHLLTHLYRVHHHRPRPFVLDMDQMMRNVAACARRGDAQCPNCSR